MRVLIGAPKKQKGGGLGPNNDDEEEKAKATTIFRDNHHHHPIMPLQIMLFCSGNGNAPYREMADMTQWWNRRDALVRCVAASCSMVDKVWLYFPNDQTVLRMDLLKNKKNQQRQRRIISSPFVPSERHVIGLWKRAAERPGTETTIFDDNETSPQISCTMDRYHGSYYYGNDDDDDDNDDDRPAATTTTKQQQQQKEGDSTKRDILERIQKQADLKFLRYHRLNSSTDSILRRVSRETLLKVEQVLWQQQQVVVVQQQHQQEQTKGRRRRPEQQQDDESPPSPKMKKQKRNDVDADDDDDPLVTILRAFLGEDDDELSSSSSNDAVSTKRQKKKKKKVYAVTLHESARHELPCWDDPILPPLAATHDDDDVVCLFLGAVRDMTEREKMTLRSVVNHMDDDANRNTKCSSHDNNNVVRYHPLISVRLGPVAEFTSKILTIAGYHYYTGRLVPALDRLLSLLPTTTTSVATTMTTMIPPPSLPPLPRSANHIVVLHYMLLPDICSTELSDDLTRRHYTLWCLVRCVVAGLWRSKLGGARIDSGSGNQNNNDQSNNDNNNNIVTTTTTTTRHIVTIIYTDGKFQTLDQENLVLVMARAHQAAPCEYQILHALLSTDVLPMMQNGNNKLVSQRQRQQPMDYIVDFSMKEESNDDDDDTDGTRQRFYDSVDDHQDRQHRPRPTNHHHDKKRRRQQTKPPSLSSRPTTIAVVLPITRTTSGQKTDQKNDERQNQRLHSILFPAVVDNTASSSSSSSSSMPSTTPPLSSLPRLALEPPSPIASAHGITTTTTTTMRNGHDLVSLPIAMMDRPAAWITLVQHLAYQNRLVPLLASSSLSRKQQKTKKKKKKRSK